MMAGKSYAIDFINKIVISVSKHICIFGDQSVGGKRRQRNSCYINDHNVVTPIFKMPSDRLEIISRIATID